MTVFVIATALQMGGAVTIFRQFLSHLAERAQGDRYVLFVNDRLPQLPIPGVEYVLLPILPKFRRIMSEVPALRREAKRLGVKPDVVLSLQNSGYSCFGDCPQIVYYHQALPLYPGRYVPLNRQDNYLFFYKHVFPRWVRRTWTPTTRFVVQTEVVKQRFSRLYSIAPDRVVVCFPDIERIDAESVSGHVWGDDYHHLLFVGDDSSYRNGRLLIRAMALLHTTHPDLAARVRIHITASRSCAPKMWAEAQRQGVVANVLFDGAIPHSELLSRYKTATALLFPSRIETIGLAALEAAVFGLPVISIDADYARYVLRDYEGVSFVPDGDCAAWAQAMADVCLATPRHRPLSPYRQTEWGRLFDLIKA
ncbi:MAG: glycosyltransferase family 4 protein [Bacteroidaceae bacterium]|nr:glycosyltransferase family 4 protein [Bacteroidaceae bacterium]